jgi:hypothetical protein
MKLVVIKIEKSIKKGFSRLSSNIPIIPDYRVYVVGAFQLTNMLCIPVDEYILYIPVG